MSAELTTAQEALVVATIRRGVHELFLEHPEYLELGAETVVAIFQAGAKAGAAIGMMVSQ